MKQYHPFSLFAVVSCSALLLVGCGNPQKQAEKSLTNEGYELTTEGLLLAAGAGDIESLEWFESAGFDIDQADKAGNTVLIKAASAGQLAAVEKILGMGADPRHTNLVGRDALIVSSARGHEDVSRMLISRGADSAARDEEGWGALSIAAYNGHAGVVSLLASQADAAELDDALLVASFGGDDKVINTLLGQGANINARSPENRTPLMIAAENGKADAVRTLLQNQANPYAEDPEGNTAANLAQLGDHEEIYAMIMNPDSWGSTSQSLAVVNEMSEAQKALLVDQGIEETLEPAPADEMVESAPDKIEPADRVKIREEAKSKPVVALNGSTLHSRAAETAPVKTMVLSSFHEEPLPIEVTHVDGNQAEIRRLDQESAEPVTVAAGSSIPGTPYQVKSVDRKFVSSKEGKGRMVDVSRVTVENKENGATHLLVKDIGGQSSDTYAILTAPNSQYRYVVKSGDVFRTSQPNTGVKDFQVLDIRASGVVVKDLETEEVLTIARDGVLGE